MITVLTLMSGGDEMDCFSGSLEGLIIGLKCARSVSEGSECDLSLFSFTLGSLASTS